MEKIKAGRQYRNMVLETRDEDEYIVEGYATTFNEPYIMYSDDDIEIWEQVAQDAFKTCDMNDCIMQYNHEGKVFARVSNETLELSTDNHGLLIKGYLGGTSSGRQLYEEIKGGYTTKMSFGFTVGADDVEESKEGGKQIYLRTIRKISKLYDVSAVSIPANDGTEISARAFIDGVIAKAEAERLLKAENERKHKKMELKLKLLNMEEKG